MELEPYDQASSGKLGQFGWSQASRRLCIIMHKIIADLSTASDNIYYTQYEMAYLSHCLSDIRIMRRNPRPRLHSRWDFIHWDGVDPGVRSKKLTPGQKVRAGHIEHFNIHYFLKKIRRKLWQ